MMISKHFITEKHKTQFHDAYAEEIKSTHFLDTVFCFILGAKSADSFVPKKRGAKNKRLPGAGSHFKAKAQGAEKTILPKNFYSLKIEAPKKLPS